MNQYKKIILKNKRVKKHNAGEKAVKKTEAKIGVMQPQAKEYSEAPETGRGEEQNVP